MSFKFIKHLPTPDEIKQEHPLPERFAEIKRERDAEIRDVITGKSRKFLVIIGPCSADNEDSVCEYISRLAKVNDRVKDKLILIPESIPTSPEPPGRATRASSISPIRRRSPTSWPG